MVTHRDLAMLRVVAQRLAGPKFATAADAVRWLGAVQAQDLPGALTSVALRTGGGARAEVAAALNSGAVVRSWPMRGTLHLLPAQDLSWKLALTAPRMMSGASKRRAELGIDEALLDRARTVALTELQTRAGLRRAELMALWLDAGLLPQAQTGYHLLAHLCQEGTLVLGPLAAAEPGAARPAASLEQLIVPVARWAPHQVDLGREEALREWALRYVRSHGPVTEKDFARWASLTLTDARRGIAAASSELATITSDDVPYVLDPAAPDLLAEYRAEAAALLLLPGFDEFMLGYGDRSAALPLEYAERIVPGGNGVFQPTVVVGGQVVGTWKRVGKGAKQSITAVPFAAFSAAQEKAIARRFAALP